MEMKVEDVQAKVLKYVGNSRPLLDSKQKVRGAIRYGSDMGLDHMAYARLLLSPHPHAYIKDIDVSKAKELPNVIEVFTYKNTPDTKYSRYRLLPEQETAPADEVLFSRKVRCVGDRVAAVVARDKETARMALDLITVNYEKLPAFIRFEESIETDQAVREGSTERKMLIHEGGNILYEYDSEIGEKSSAAEENEEEDKDDPVRTVTEVSTQRIHHAAMENNNCLADYDSETLTIYTGSQGTFGVRTVVGDFLGIRYNKIRVIKVPVGGSFGVKQEAILEPVTAYMAYALQQPVKLLFDRKDTILATMVRPETKTKIETVFSKDGMLKEVSADSIVNAGAYATNSVDYSKSLSQKLTRLYRIPYYRHRGKAVYTNTLVGGGMRGWGSPEMITATEVHMDAAAARLGIDPVELRLKNLVHPFDYDPCMQLSLENARVIDCLNIGAKEFRWKERFKASPGTGRFRKGVGFACAAHKNGSGGKGVDHSSMVMKLNEDGSFVLQTGLHELGGGIITTMTMIASEVLGAEIDDITVLEADTELGPYDMGTYGSRVTYVCGACTGEIAGLMRDRILSYASSMFNVAKELLVVQDGSVWPRGREEEKLSFREIAIHNKTRSNEDIIVSHTYSGKKNPGVYGVHFAEVEVDTLTGMTRVTDYLAVHDIGKAINPMMVEGQIDGSVQMGIGYALCEEVAVDEKGMVKADNFRDYHLINASAMPRVKTILVEEGEESGPFGAKSIGEVAVVPVAGAVVNAVNRALGTALYRLPLSPERVIEALDNMNSKNED
jgi:CO/xanthine dehydrogenase Mo-binding subunit